MPIDNTSCINVINTLKGYITACFSKCTAKGSTYSGTQNLANLETAIDLIPQSQSGGTGGEKSTGANQGTRELGGELRQEGQRGV